MWFEIAAWIAVAVIALVGVIGRGPRPPEVVMHGIVLAIALITLVLTLTHAIPQ